MTSKFKINTETKVTVVIPFRDRGTDLRRGANLTIVMAWWWAHGFTPQVVDDGLDGDAPFNRHRAYNRAVARFPETDVFVFTEADMLIPPSQIKQAVQLLLELDLRFVVGPQALDRPLDLRVSFDPLPHPGACVRRVRSVSPFPARCFRKLDHGVPPSCLADLASAG